MSLFRAAVVVACLTLALAGESTGPRRVDIARYAGRVNNGSYIVTLKPGTDKSAVLANLRLPGLTHTDWDPSLLNGFAGRFDGSGLESLRSHPEVAAIEEDGFLETAAVQSNAPWGLARLSSTAPGTSRRTYRYHDAYQGAGVDIYIIDSGIYTAHTEFGGRARHGWAAPGLSTTDDFGHGTFIAGVAIGTKYGVAKQASAIGVKVFDGSGSGTVSGVIAALSFVAASSATSGRPSIAVLAFTGTAFTALDNAVTALANTGIPVVVAAGNSNSDASQFSPPRVQAAVTVGASTSADSAASFSNYGSVLDYYAPGDGIPSAWITSTTATITLIGTSGAAAHVAGLFALWNSQYGNFTGGVWHQDGVLSGVPSGTLNRLAVGPIQI